MTDPHVDQPEHTVYCPLLEPIFSPECMAAFQPRSSLAITLTPPDAHARPERALAHGAERSER